MILQEQIKHKAKMPEGMEVSTAKIKISAQTFRVLSDGLYSNKIAAILRELGCNALDAQKDAGDDQIPFDVHLPTQLEPFFFIRDYGTGMTDEQIRNLYMTYGESTKTESNLFTGALGLGSKTPLSYTNNFTVTSFQKGSKSVFSVFINDDGIPAITKLFGGETDETDGLEVKFAVTSSSDFYSFEREAQNIYTWFDNVPKFVGKHVSISAPRYSVRFSDEIKFQETGSSVVVMGNIAYKISSNDFSDAYAQKIKVPLEEFKLARKLLDYSIALFVPIGAVSFSANREQLSYDDATIKTIYDLLSKARLVVMNHVTSELKKASDSPWKLAKKFNELKRYKFIKAINLEEMYNALTVPKFDQRVDNLIGRGVIPAKFGCEIRYKEPYKVTCRSYISNNLNIHPTGAYTVIRQDDKKITQAKIKLNFSHDYTSVLFIKDLKDPNVPYDPKGLMAALFLDYDDIKKINPEDLKVPEKVKRPRVDKILVPTYRSTGRYGSNKMVLVSEPMSHWEKEECVYVVLDKESNMLDYNNSALTKDTRRFAEIWADKQMVNKLVYIKEKQREDVPAAWIELSDYLELKVSELDEKFIRAHYFENGLSEAISTIVKQTPDHPIAKHITNNYVPMTYMDKNHLNMFLYTLPALCGKINPYEYIETEIKEADKQLRATYPLLWMIRDVFSDQAKHIKDYIQSIDAKGASA